MKQTILLATTNSAKIERFLHLFERLSAFLKEEIEFKTPADFGLDELEIEENGKNEQENAYLKAKGFWDALDEKIPCLALDSGCYFENVDQEDQPGQHVRRIAGAGSKFSYTSDEAVIKHYTKIAQKYGGEVNGYYLDCFCLFAGYSFEIPSEINVEDEQKELELKEKTGRINLNNNSNVGGVTEIVLQNFNKREIILTDKCVGDYPGFPMMTMWKGKKTGKYRAQMSESEYISELQPMLNSLYDILISLPKNNELTIGVFQPTMMLRPRVMGVLRDGESYLGFIKNYGPSKGKLTWVGGGIEYGEIPEQALIREIKEELGYVELETKNSLGQIIHYFKSEEYEVASVTYGFEVEVLDKKNKIEAEIDDGRYSLVSLTAKEFMEQSEFEVSKKFLS